MSRSLARVFLVCLLLPAGAGAQQVAQAQLQTELRLERQMLALDLVTYNESREQDRRAQQAVSAVLARLDTALAGDSVSLGTLESLQNDLDAARATMRITEERLTGQIGRIQERLRRIGLLEGEARTPARAAADPVTGTWRVTVLPQNAAATFSLRLNGTVVSGSYQVAGGTGGSFRGTYAAGNLRLERIDANGGFDSVWVGTVADGRIAGTWNSNELVTGQPNRGDWTAVRESGP